MAFPADRAVAMQLTSATVMQSLLIPTSAADKLTPEQRRREPLARALLRLRPGETGVARPYLLR